MLLKYVFLKHYLSMNKANVNNKIIEGVQYIMTSIYTLVNKSFSRAV